MVQEMTDNRFFNGDPIALATFKSKYAAHPKETPDEMHLRMAKEFARIRKNKQISGNLDESKLVDLFYNLMKDFKYIVPQGSVMAILGTNTIGSLSNCFVIGQPYDSYSGILHKDEELASLMKRRGGVGLDLSTLRPKGIKVNNAAKSSTGAASFMERYSNTTREVAQEGRRGALMLTMDIRHPDVLDFINAKKDRTKVTGANISVMLRNDFMEAVEKDEDYILRFPCDLDLSKFTPGYVDANYNEIHYIEDHTNKNEVCYVKKIRAKEYYEAIVENAWENAEPGQMFVDRHWNYSPDSVYKQYKGVTTNPCGEIFMQQYDACRLILLNLASFVNNPFEKNAEIDYDKLYNLAYEMQLMADDLVDLEIEYIQRIIDKIVKDTEPNEIKKRELSLWLKIQHVAQSSRRTGCGITALADMLAMLGIQYNSELGIATTEKVMKTIMNAELLASIHLAQKFGPFDGWDPNLEKNDFYTMLETEFPVNYKLMQQFGRRNVSWSTVAPAGTVSLMTQTTSGLEPLFMPYYIRRTKINPTDTDKRIDFVDQNGDKWMEYAILHPKFKEWLEYNNYEDVENYSKDTLDLAFLSSPWHGSVADNINPDVRISMQSSIQKYTSHSISSTINLPNTVTKEEVGNLYKAAWKAGLKGVTVYRDGSRSGVLVKESKEEFSYRDAPKRPTKLPAYVHHITVAKKPYTVIVGLLDSKPYEIFVTEDHLDVEAVNEVIKKKKGLYETKEGFALSTYEDPNVELMTRLVSTSLRHGADIKFIVEQLNKTSGDITSFSTAVSRVLKKYIPDGAKSTLVCLDCGSNSIIFEEGCEKCKNCGSSKCG